MRKITSEELNQLKSENKKILLDLYADWCGPCKILIPKLETFESDYSDVEFVKMNVDEETSFAVSLGVRSVPTVIIMDGENVVSRTSGIQPDDYYKKILDTI